MNVYECVRVYETQNIGGENGFMWFLCVYLGGARKVCDYENVKRLVMYA